MRVAVGEAVDLFGNPERPGRGQKGRPRFAVTARDRDRVRMLLAMGWSNPRIAATIEVSLPTLHRYFGKILAERDMMRDRMIARRAELLWQQAESGNVGALKEVAKLMEANDRKTWAEGLRDSEEMEKPDSLAPVAKAKALGKKEEAVQAASDAIAADPDLNATLFSGKLN
jgi:hypothetical protein